MLESAPAKAARLALDVKFARRRTAGAAYPEASFDVASSRSASGTWTTRCAAARDGPGGEARRERDRAGIRPAAAARSARCSAPIAGSDAGGGRPARRATARVPVPAADGGCFPAGEKFLELMRESSAFAHIEAHPLTFGTAYVYRGVK